MIRLVCLPACWCWEVLQTLHSSSAELSPNQQPQATHTHTPTLVRIYGDDGAAATAEVLTQMSFRPGYAVLLAVG